MTIAPSKRGQSIPGSATLTITAKANSLRAAGVDVVTLAAGQPDYDTPAHIVEAARRALQEKTTYRYAPTAGTPALRSAVAEVTGRYTGNAYAEENVIVTAGAKQSLFNLMQVLTDPGDEVVIPAPYWVSYVPMALAAGAKPVTIPTDGSGGFRITPDQLKGALTPRSRILVLNSPSNPTGSGYAQTDLDGLAEVVLGHPNLIVISDEIYRQLVYGDFVHRSFATLSPETAARTVIVDGVSKAYAMTGWRIGFAIGDARLIAAAKSLQDHSTSCAAVVSQEAALAAITGPQECVAEMRAAFAERRQALIDRLGAIDGLTAYPPLGAFYAFVDYRSALPAGATPDDVAACSYLLEEAHTAVVPGSAFGVPGHFRLGYACAKDRLLEGLDRIERALPGLKRTVS